MNDFNAPISAELHPQNTVIFPLQKNTGISNHLTPPSVLQPVLAPIETPGSGFSKMKHARTAPRVKRPAESQKTSQLKKEIAAAIKQAFDTMYKKTDAKYKGPEFFQEQINAIIEKYFAPPSSKPVDLAAISDTTADRFEHVALSTHPITRRRIKTMRTRVSRLWFWKPRHMAEFLNISRPHLQNIIAGRKDWDAEFDRRFRLLERHITAWTAENKEHAQDVLTVTSAHRLPAAFEILAQPIQCKVCKRWIAPVTPNQKYCPEHKP